MLTATSVDAGLQSLLGTVQFILGDIERAEAEIEAACAASPLHLRPLVFGAFLMLRPHFDMPVELYRAHVRELLNRVQCGGNIHEPTDAEVATVFVEASHVAPFHGDGAAAYFTAVRAARPDLVARLDVDKYVRPAWPGQDDEMIGEVRAKLARRLPKREHAAGRIPGGVRLADLQRRRIRFPKEHAVNPLYTIGYSGLDRNALAAFVQAEGALVIDTRLVPQSRLPQWRKAALERALGERYRHVVELGNVNYKTDGPVELKDQTNGLRIVLQALAEQPVVLLCGCRDVVTCHRKTVAELTGWPRVEHLRPDDLSPQLPLL